MTSTPLLRVEHLRISTATGRLLVDGVSFDVEPGESVAIVGESGSGKSLTMRAVAGLLPSGLHTEGSIVFGGAETLGASETELARVRGHGVSLLMQDPFTMLNPMITAAAHIEEGLPKEVRADAKRLREEVRRRMEEVGLDSETVGRRYPFQLSGGMRQRLAMAAALTKDPKLLIADEPTTALDASTQAEILDMLKRLQRSRGMAIVFVTHDLGVAFTIGSRVVVMYAGSVLEQGPSERLTVRPAHPYTHGLLGSQVPMGHRSEHLSSIPGSVPQASEVVSRCAFAARCPWSTVACTSGKPGLVPRGTAHESACVRFEEIEGELRFLQDPAGQGGDGAASGRRSSGDTDAKSSSQEPPLLEVTSLTKTYYRGSRRNRQAHAALTGVSFEVYPGEAVGLIGESGSGKTTIARCMLGLAEPDSGEIRLGSLDLSDYTRLRLREQRETARLIQIVFQDPYSSLNPSRSIGAALREAVQVRGDGDPKTEAGALLELVGLPTSYLELRPAQLSGGERQRVAIARAMALRPRLLVCDEPVASLDVSVQAEILKVLREVSEREGTATLFITHDLAVARQMTERLIVLYQGEIVEQGATDQVLDEPTHDYTKRLISAVASHELHLATAPGDGGPA